MNYLGIDLGGTNIRAALIDEQGKFWKEKEVETKAEESAEMILDRLLTLVKTFSGFEAIGIGVPGPIDYKGGVILNPPNLPSLHNLNLKQLLENNFHLPVAMDRDSNCALIGEHWLGEARGLKNVAMLTWGTGVGGAVIIDNKIFRGHSDIAGEIGHMIIDTDGPACNMGHKGCLESFIGGRAIEDRYGRDFKSIDRGAREGRPEDMQIVREVGRKLAIGLNNIITLFDPELVLLGGSAVQSVDLFLDYIKDMPVKISKNAKKAGVIGAARIAMKNQQ